MEKIRTIKRSSAKRVRRRWEDLKASCLIKIFEKVGLESLIIDIPFVCKSWYKASLDPILYQVLHFEVMPVEERTTWATVTAPPKGPGAQKKYSKLPPSTGFIKIAVKRSCDMATEAVFPELFDDFSLLCHFTESALNYATLVYVIEMCPALRSLFVPYYSFSKAAENTDGCLFEMISKLKNLQCIATLTVGEFRTPTSTVKDMSKIFDQTHINCQNFQSLFAQGVISSDFASTIATSFPNIKHLVLSGSILSRDDLIRILSGCRKLVLLDVSRCGGFDGNDATILKLASHIKIFKSEGSSVFDVSDED